MKEDLTTEEIEPFPLDPLPVEKQEPKVEQNPTRGLQELDNVELHNAFNGIQDILDSLEDGYPLDNVVLQARLKGVQKSLKKGMDSVKRL